MNVEKLRCCPFIEIPTLISWLNDQKYTNVDETSDTMTEEFEREHQWELSRNSFINKMIRQLKMEFLKGGERNESRCHTLR